jgi:hypothetical protein
MITLSEVLNGLWISSLICLLIVGALVIGLVAGRLIAWILGIFFPERW